MDQCGPPAEVHDSLSADIDDSLKKDTGCDNSPKGSLSESNLEDIDKTNIDLEVDNPKLPNTPRSVSSINLRSTSKTRIEYQPDVGRTGPPPTTHSNMKTKQIKEELDKSIDEETTIEPKTRARKKASEISEEVKSNSSQDEPKTSKDPKKPISKPKAVAKKRPLGIRKTLRSKKTVITKDKVKNVIKQAVKRGRKAAIKTEPENSQEKETVPLIPASEIKKEPADDTTPNSRSSSPRTAGRRQRLSSDLIMMKSMLGDSPSSLVLGPRTSPYSMRSERSNSPSMFEGKNLRSGKPRKVKNNLLNEVVMKEQKKRRRLLSDSKGPEATEGSEDCKKLKRGRSCSRDGSEISKCSDITESDLSLSESINDTDGKELNKKLDKPKTELDLDIETNVQISTIEKVPSLNVDSKLAETKQDTEPSCIVNEKNKKSLSLKRSTSLDSDNNNSNRLKLENLNSSDVEDKSSMKTENDTLFEARSSILTSMSKTFNSKEVSKNIRKARRGRKAAAATRTSPNQAKNCISSTITNEPAEEKQETLESLSKEIDDLINNLDQNIDCDISNDVNANATDQLQTKPASKSYNASKPLGDNNSIICPETPVKDKDALATITNDSTPSKNDDSENIRLHYEDDTTDKSTDSPKQEVTFKCTPVASIDKLMDRLKEFEEFDKRRQRQESESKSSDGKPVILTSDVVLITKSGTDIKHLKDIQTVRSPERPIEKENVLSCFENNSAISIVKRDQFRKSIDVDLPNSVTLIKRNSISARKESTSSNHSRESDAISIFEKSLGKDVTLTEIRKSVDRPAPAQVDLHQFATLHPTNPNQSLAGVVLDSSQISITPRIVNEVQITKRKSRESMSRKSSESTIELDEKVVTIEKIKSPTHQIKNLEVSITPNPVAVKSPEAQPVETEALAPPLDSVKDLPENITLTSKVTEVTKAETPKVEPVPVETAKAEIAVAETPKVDAIATTEVKPETEEKPEIPVPNPEKIEPEKMEVDSVEEKPKKTVPPQDDVKATEETKPTEPIVKTVKDKKTTRHSMDSQPGPSNVLHETPESQKRKENVLRTLGLLTHKAAKEAKIEKLKEKERIYMMSNKSKAVKSGSGDYTGTLKTVIKLNRNSGEREKKKYRSSLKMTFQKSKNRSGKPQPEVGEGVNDDETYYTIERREGGTGSTSDGGHRKSYSNRLNHDIEAAPEPVEPKEILNLVIPEKASSFSIHPGRLCMDQCFYCGGKFGLFDTPCHIAQMKSSERQKKVLDNEEKLTIDSCLCDACYRHVDRRANCPSYRKRPAKLAQTLPPNNQQPAPVSPPLEDESEEEGGAGGGAGAGAGAGALAGAGARRAACHTAGCQAPADHAIRRKWLIKMRASVNKLLQLEGDYPGLHTIPLCGDHHRALAPLLACALCRRRVTKHHNAHLLHTYAETNPLLQQAGIPVQFAERPVLCKMCRYYCTLLQRPGHNEKHARGYRRKLLQIYNIEVPPESDHEPEEATVQEDPNITKQKKKTRTKSKQRKSTEPEKPGDSESSEKTESSPEKDNRTAEEEKSTSQPIEEDIESLISSNKIPVPGAKPPEQIHHSDGSETDVFDYETPSMPVDKQTELQYLLQKQNNPAQFLHKPPNLTQKHRSLMKLQNASGVTKPGQQHRINDKNAKRIQKLGQIVTNKEKTGPKEDIEMFDPEKQKDGMAIFKNLSLNDECTIETIPNKKPADINTLKNKWQMSESFSQVKKNLSELSKKLTVEKEPKKHSDAKYSNPVKRLETNPSISVRELFPGEEEMNLQCNIEFNNVKGVTPEGWEKCNTMIQYDGETKRLWNELQRPYGNQSSFLRHLILLEKYFRSGDLVLSHNASPPAANYSDSVQSRLRAYDNVVNDTPRRSEPAISLIEYRKKPSVNGKSLLKTSQGEGEKDPKKTMPPPTLPKPKPVKSDKAKSKPLPPELIAINTPNAQGRKAIQNVLHNIQQLVKGVSASDPTEVAAAPLPLPKFEPPKEKKESPKETPKKQKPTSKPWRPTLMPITPENLAKIAREPIQVAVDGRHLPSLVQVMSSGKRYHITLQDYNKMCIMRREKLQQLQDGDKTKKQDETTVVTEIQTSAMLGNGGTVVQNIQPEKETEKKEMPELGQISTNAANILKNVGLKNITIAPIPPKTATVTSQTVSSPVVTSPSLLVTSTPIKLPQLGSAVSITSETVLTPNLPIISTSMIMPKIPKSLTVIPQTVVAPSVVLPQPQNVMPQMVLPQMVPQSVVVPQSVMVPTTAAPVQPSDTPRP